MPLHLAFIEILLKFQV
jgi:hypothetical protein